MNPTLESMQKQLDEIQGFLNQLKSVNTIPRELETALRGRLGDISKVTYTPTTSAFNLTGNVQTIDVIQPTKIVKVKIGPDIYYLFAQ